MQTFGHPEALTVIRVQSPCRLHFGLLNVGASGSWANIDGASTIPGRYFGGVGMMIGDPTITIYAEPDREWSAQGPLAEKVLIAARRFAKTVPEVTPQRIRISTSALPHVGLGVGTQLSLAVAKALAFVCGCEHWDAVELARRVGRGARSAVGVHGFQHGGFIVEGGQRVEGELSPLIAHGQVPGEWRVILALPESPAGRFGEPEHKAFEDLVHEAKPQVTETLCRLVLLGVLPALAERDCRTFGEALYEFNARVGEIFAPMQGGRYATPLAADIVKFCRRHGATGVGQSSWGPLIFAFGDDRETANQLEARLSRHYGGNLSRVWVTRANELGAAF